MIIPGQVRIESRVGDNPKLFGRYAVSVVFGEFANEQDAKYAEEKTIEFIQKTFVMVEKK